MEQSNSLAAWRREISGRSRRRTRARQKGRIIVYSPQRPKSWENTSNGQ